MTRSHHHGCQHTMCQTPWLVERKVAKAPSMGDQLTYDEHLDLETDVYDQCDGCDYCDPSRANHVAYVIEHHREAVDDLIAAEDEWQRFKIEVDPIGELRRMVEDAGLTMTLHGRPIKEAELRDAALISAFERLTPG